MCRTSSSTSANKPTLKEGLKVMRKQVSQKESNAKSVKDEDDSEEDVESESAKHVNALTGICLSDAESCDEELSYEELAATYKDLFSRSTEVCKALEKRKKVNG
ncbi:gag-pol polyprotein related [Trifolium medium]|uniref:Gag-pol polyprotein related n=1 Tax=Trifolium medium TaxID=97028 RepID=A0A392P4L7_9FABA|nr:gag-pol polyprotein related [Trifolium medium]